MIQEGPSMEDRNKNSALVLWRLISAVLAVIAVVAIGVAVAGYRSASGTPQAIKGKFMGFDITGSAMDFLPTGSTMGTSYAWAPDTSWQSADGNWHDTGPVSCLHPADRGHTVTIGVAIAKPVGTAPRADLIAWVKCQPSPKPLARQGDW